MWRCERLNWVRGNEWDECDVLGLRRPYRWSHELTSSSACIPSPDRPVNRPNPRPRSGGQGTWGSFPFEHMRGEKRVRCFSRPLVSRLLQGFWTVHDPDLLCPDLVSHKDRQATTMKAVDTAGKVLVRGLSVSEEIRKSIGTLGTWQAGLDEGDGEGAGMSWAGHNRIRTWLRRLGNNNIFGF